ncbi:LysR family transcriptional regulator [Variovorax sp. OV329]|uniref:LysR family transcriptional regulator n=1 Tax=Variovorax sp. OV329 TaxID=1882825 RepID=UPI0008EA7178|nr:LysR family transcriptional regulator [Variovorax sp. OV329]SFM62518.1 transcriptional regulator, LysR family [Variovorax sp. OV329]
MKLHQLRALVAAARAGSIHEAARSLHLTQPAVTRAIRDLEDELGLTLVVRTSTGVSLTGEGRAMLRHAELVVHEVTRTEEEMARLRGSQLGRVSIGVTPLASSTVLPLAYQRFREAMPDVQLDFAEFSPAQLADQLKNGALDFALGSSMDPRDFTSLRLELLATFPMWFAVSRHGPLSGASTLAQLQDAEWLHTGQKEEFLALLSQLFGRAGLAPPRRITRCASQTLFYGLAVNGDVVTSWTELALHGARESHDLLPLHLLERPPARKLYLLYRESAVLTAPAGYFVHCIKTAVRQQQSG